jgi:putative RecB family exonuclease
MGICVAETYSHSRLSSFEDCPRRFQYRYLWKLPSETESIEGFVGKRVHEVLERLYQATGRGHVPSLPQVTQRYLQLFDDAYDPQRVAIVRTECPLAYYRDLGAQCLENFYRAQYPFDADETLGLEEHVVFELGELDGVRIRFQGFIDRIAAARDGAIEIHDYKTGSRVPKQAQLDQDRQLALYQLGLSKRYAADRPMRLVWYFVRSGRVATSTRTDAQLEALRERTLSLVRHVRSETRFEGRPSALCRWCEFRARCPDSPERDVNLPEYAPPASTASERTGPARSASAAAGSALSDQLDLPLRSQPLPAGG